MSRRTVSWSDLPPELLTLIAERVGTRTDAHNFRLVCSRWQVAASYCTRHPQNQLSPILPYKFSFPDPKSCPITSEQFNFLTLAPISVFLVRSLLDAKLTPWLITFEELNPGKLFLRRPLYQDTNKSWPSSLTKKFNPSYFAVSEIGRSYTLWSGASSMFSKVVLPVDPNCPTLPNDVIGLKSDGSLELVSLKFRTKQKLTCSKIKVYDDVVNFEGTVFAIDRKGRAYIVEHKERRLRNVVPVPVGEGLGSDMKKRLAAETCTGELFLVHRSPVYFKAMFKIYKLNKERNKWDEVVGIGDDRVLFVASGGCFFAKTKDLPGWRGNSMVFRKGEFLGYNSHTDTVADLEIFEKKRGSPQDLDIAVFHFDTGDWEHIASQFHYFDLVRPQPPHWLMSDAQVFNRMSAAVKQVARDLLCPVADDSAKEGPRIIDMDLIPAIKLTENCTSQGTFKGVTVSGNLTPDFQKIWDSMEACIKDM